MDSIRVEAKTVADAVTEASIQLGTSSDNIEYTVISEGSRGFFGIGGKKAVIEAKKKFTDDDLMKEIFGGNEKPEKAKKEPKKEIRKEKQENKCVIFTIFIYSDKIKRKIFTKTSCKYFPKMI